MNNQTSPTVTAVSDERLREFAFGPRHTAPLFAEMESMARELLRARSALADVGECELIDAERLAELITWLDNKWKRHQEYEDHEAAEALREYQQLRTGKQPCPAAEAKCATCGEHANEHGAINHMFVERESPAAHTAQVTEALLALLAGARLLDRVPSTRHGEYAATLRRLAEQENKK